MKWVSDYRSRHEDSNGPRIVKIGAVLGHLWLFQSLQKKSQLPKEPTMSDAHNLSFVCECVVRAWVSWQANRQVGRLCALRANYTALLGGTL